MWKYLFVEFYSLDDFFVINLYDLLVIILY